MNCPECGAILEDNSKFCVSCGANLDSNAEASSNASPVPLSTEDPSPLTQIIIPSSKYNTAAALAEAGDYAAATIKFWEISDYSDARERSLALWAAFADRKTLSAGELHTVGLRADGTVVTTDNSFFCQSEVGGFIVWLYIILCFLL